MMRPACVHHEAIRASLVLGVCETLCAVQGPTLVVKLHFLGFPMRFILAVVASVSCLPSWELQQDLALEAARFVLKKNGDSRGRIAGGSANLEPVEIYFIRHAQSAWNEAEKTVSKLTNAPHRPEWKDAKLSDLGLTQARKLAEAVENIPAAVASNRNPLIDSARMQAGLSVLAGLDPPLRSTTYIATSNLRRALLTGLIALRSRHKVAGVADVETVHILSSTQELSMGADAHTLASRPGQIPVVPSVYMEGFTIDASLNQGEENKGLNLFDARLAAFCSQLQGIAFRYRRMILTGHSKWVQYLFKKFLRKPVNEVESRLRKTKLGNASVIKFSIEFGGNKWCRIRPAATSLIFGDLH